MYVGMYNIESVPHSEIRYSMHRVHFLLRVGAYFLRNIYNYECSFFDSSWNIFKLRSSSTKYTLLTFIRK